MEKEKKSLLKNQTFLAILGLGILIVLCIMIYIILKSIWNSIKDYPTITVAIITGFYLLLQLLYKEFGKKGITKNKKLEIINYQYIKK